MSVQQLTLQIEGLRSEMIRTAETIGSLNHPQVIALSQELDQLLVIMQRLKKKNRPPRYMSTSSGLVTLGELLQ